MSTTTGIKPAAATAVDRAVTWQMWVPCVTMALCSWISFFHRTILQVLAPVILKDTGMTQAEYASVNAYFFVAYTLGNPLWGSIIDFVGLRTGMLLGVAIWTVASVSHSWVSAVIGFAVVRVFLGLGEGVTFPGGLRTAVESLPPSRRARAIAMSFSGGTLGGVGAALIGGPIGLAYGWRMAFIITGAFGLVWIVLWALIARPPFLPREEKKTAKLAFPKLSERRLWALVFSYGLPCIAPGPILTLLSLYLSGHLGLSQREINYVFWMPPAAWGVGYFFWGWFADRFAQENRRPVGLFVFLTVCSIALGFTTWSTSVAFTMALMSWACFIAGGFQMVALKVGSYSFPREQAAMMTGIASGSFALVNYVLLQFPGVGLGALFSQKQYAQAFWIVALCPVVGVVVWLFLSRNQSTQNT